MEFSLTEEEQRILLAVARSAIYERLALEVDPATAENAGRETSALREPCGAFVTLHTPEGRLRGCIGRITASGPLKETVEAMAQAAAFEDPRFPRVTVQEAPGLSIEISVLSPLRTIENVEEITVGVHGILISRGYRSGLLLPQVATEQGWDRETFLDHTCLKAGLPAGCWREAGVEIQIFSALVFNEQ